MALAAVTADPSVGDPREPSVAARRPFLAPADSGPFSGIPSISSIPGIPGIPGIPSIRGWNPQGDPPPTPKCSSHRVRLKHPWHPWRP